MSDDLFIPAERDLPAGRLQRRKEHLVSELNMWDRALRRRRRRLALILVPAVVVVLGVTGFTTYALTREPTHLESIGCFEREDPQANVSVVNADGRSPTAICLELWREYGIEGGSAPTDATACVLESGAVGVFPSASPDTCEKLGLAELPASYAAESERFAALRDAIVAHLGEPTSGSSAGSPKCLGENEARVLVRRELDAHGYGDWRIDVSGPFTAERPCAEVAFDGELKKVVLVPTWDE